MEYPVEQQDVAPAYKGLPAEVEGLGLGLVVVVHLVADLVEKLAQVVLVQTGWLPPGQRWHLFVGGPCQFATHSTLDVDGQSPFFATLSSQPHSPDWPSNWTTPLATHSVLSSRSQNPSPPPQNPIVFHLQPHLVEEGWWMQNQKSVPPF